MQASACSYLAHSEYTLQSANNGAQQEAIAFARPNAWTCMSNSRAAQHDSYICAWLSRRPVLPVAVIAG